MRKYQLVKFFSSALIIAVVLVFSPGRNDAQTLDTALISDLREFFFRQTGFRMKGDFFTQWDNSPYFIKFISLPDRIESPPEMKLYDETRDDDTLSNAAKTKLLAGDNDYQVMNYDAPADGRCKIRPEFPTYSPDGLAFVIFHEMMHNFTGQKHLFMSGIFEEAVCDIMGDYLTLAFAAKDKRISVKAATKQIRINDSIYASINRCIAVINEHPGNMAEAQKKCAGELQSFLKNANEFQKFRFGYEVNNGFLLKCRSYSWNHFIFKKIFLEQKSIGDFLAVLEALSGNMEHRSPVIMGYLEELGMHTNWFINVDIEPDSFLPATVDSGGFSIGVTNRDPVNSYLIYVNSVPDTVTITPQLCMDVWNRVLNTCNNKTQPSGRSFLLTGSSAFGTAWLVTTAFTADGRIMCWDEELNLLMGKTQSITLSKDNATFLEIQRK